MALQDPSGTQKVKLTKVKKHKKNDAAKEPPIKAPEQKDASPAKVPEGKTDKGDKKEEKKDAVPEDDDDIFAFNDSSSKQKYDVDKLEELKHILFTQFEQDF